MSAPLRDLDTIDPTFLEDLDASQLAVWRVARWLQHAGENVTVRAVRVRPSTDQIREYSDAGDLELIQRVEVKHRHHGFTGANDYPYAMVLVDSAHVWDAASPKPLRYIIVNETVTAAAIVEGATSSRWIKKTIASRGRNRTVYFCPIALARFVTFEDWV